MSVRSNYTYAVFVNRACKRKSKWTHENRIIIFSGDLLLISNKKIKWQLKCSSCQTILLISQKIISALSSASMSSLDIHKRRHYCRLSDVATTAHKRPNDRKKKGRDRRGSAHRADSRQVQVNESLGMKRINGILFSARTEATVNSLFSCILRRRRNSHLEKRIDVTLERRSQRLQMSTLRMSEDESPFDNQHPSTSSNITCRRVKTRNSICFHHLP